MPGSHRYEAGELEVFTLHQREEIEAYYGKNGVVGPMRMDSELNGTGAWDMIGNHACIWRCVLLLSLKRGEMNVGCHTSAISRRLCSSNIGTVG